MVPPRAPLRKRGGGQAGSGPQARVHGPGSSCKVGTGLGTAGPAGGDEAGQEKAAVEIAEGRGGGSSGSAAIGGFPHYKTP